MPITVFETHSPVVVVMDFNLESDLNYDRENNTNNSVYRLWGAATRYVTRAQWSSLTKVCLFPWSTNFKVDKAAPAKERTTRRKELAHLRDTARAELSDYLRKRKPKLVVVLQTRSKTARKNKEIESAELEGVEGTVVWSLFKAPASMASLFGTVFESPFGPCMALPNPVNYEFVYEHLIRLWLNAALAYGVMGDKALLQCPRKCFRREDITDGLRRVLASARRSVMVSVDLEFVPGTSTITVMGLSDGETAVAVPWDAYQFLGEDDITAGRTMEWDALTKSIFAEAKIVAGHNFLGADLPMLAKQGLEVKGRIIDSFILHAIVFKQYRAGLQQACSQEFLIRPWKDSFRPTDKYSKDDPEYWTTNPLALRDYNCDDSFHTWHLVKSLAWKAGVKL